MADQFAWWRDALAGKNPPVHEDQPQPGYYKTRRARGTGPWTAVAVWQAKDGKLRAHAGQMKQGHWGESVDPVRIWTFLAKNPIPYKDWKHYDEHGEFPGDAPTIGHNQGPPLTWDQEIDAAVETAQQMLAAPKEDDPQAVDRFANMRDKLHELAKQADKERVKLKEPHLKAEREIDAKFQPYIKKAQAVAGNLRDVVTRILRAREAEQRKKEEAALAEALAKREAENPAPDLPPIAIPTPKKIQAGGQYGSKTGLKTVVKFEIEDYTAVFEHPPIHDHPDVIAAVTKVAFAMARAGATVPGVKRIEDRVAT